MCGPELRFTFFRAFCCHSSQGISTISFVIPCSVKSCFLAGSLATADSTNWRPTTSFAASILNSLAAPSRSDLFTVGRRSPMNNPTTAENIPESPAIPAGSGKPFRPLRAWPALLFALLMVAARFGPAISDEGAAKYWMVAVFGPLLCCLLLLIWWLAASRATWRERLFGFLGLVASAAVGVALAHPTMRGAATTYFTLPLGFFVFAVAAALLKKSPPAVRSGTAVLLAFAGFAVSMLLRNDGMTGDYKFAFRARWKQTAEDAMLAARKSDANAPKASARIDNSLTNALA